MLGAWGVEEGVLSLNNRSGAAIETNTKARLSSSLKLCGFICIAANTCQVWGDRFPVLCGGCSWDSFVSLQLHAVHMYRLRESHAHTQSACEKCHSANLWVRCTHWTRMVTGPSSKHFNLTRANFPWFFELFSPRGSDSQNVWTVCTFVWLSENLIITQGAVMSYTLLSSLFFACDLIYLLGGFFCLYWCY